jgi:hypothetical protein
MFDILYDLHQNGKIGEASAKANAGLRQAERAGDRVGDVEERLDKMALLNLALWTLLREKLGVTDEELAKRVEELDLRDGKLDGRVQGTPIDCPDCARPLHQRHRRCLYCGFSLPHSGFEAVAR